jgi:hypothetical protein
MFNPFFNLGKVGHLLKRELAGTSLFMRFYTILYYTDSYVSLKIAKKTSPGSTGKKSKVDLSELHVILELFLTLKNNTKLISKITKQIVQKLK